MSLLLAALSEASIRALYAGADDWADGRPELVGVDWPDVDRRVLGYRVEALDAHPSAAPYLLHAILLDGDFVGRIGCHAGPDASGEVEIGYAVVPSARRRGIAGQAVDSFTDWLVGQGVTRIKASVRPDNEPSMRLLGRRGFIQVGEQWDDEDGLELILAKDLQPVEP